MLALIVHSFARYTEHLLHVKKYVLQIRTLKTAPSPLTQGYLPPKSLQIKEIIGEWIQKSSIFD